MTDHTSSFSGANTEHGDEFVSEENDDDLEDEPKPLDHYIREGMKQLHQEQLLCDTTIVAGGERFPCHRMLLVAINPYFRAMFSSSFRESREGEVLLKGIDPAIVQMVVTYCYTEEVVLRPEMAQDLFVAASRLQILPLLESCSRFLLERISVENCLSLYELGYAHNDPALHQQAESLVVLHFKQLSAEDQSFLNLNPCTVASIISLNNLMISSELVVYKAVLRWVMAQATSRRSFLTQLLRNVRLPLLTQEELREVQSESTHYRDFRLRWKRLNRQERLQESGGLRQGMYNTCIVCVDLFSMEGPDLKTKDFQVACLDPQTETWEKLPLLKCFYCARCVAMGDKLYVTGGVHTDDTYSNNLHEYSPLRNRWIQLPSMSVARASHGFLACGQKLFAVGGWFSYEYYLDTAESFDLVEKSWTPIANMPVALSHFASTVLKNRLYLIGGVSDSAGTWYASRKILIYNITTDLWSQVLMDNECYWSGAVAMNSGIYVVGGYFRRRTRGRTERWPGWGNLRCSRRCFFLQEDGKVDRSVHIPWLPVKLAGAAVVRWKHRIYVLGGENTCLYNDPEGEDEKYYNTVYYWELGASSWTLCKDRLPFTGWGLSGFGCTTMKFPKKPILELFRKTSVALTAIDTGML
ncbi:actin-binding protein IPP-like [Sphaerodactylus townsendi]|uniref:actin-binding protein IPP-like n=1 Tax=Sphaerodactylus townsendi TaxID=933632 RepID=UPI002025D3F0|nr:actin-binding protein IPP-like [Sphaerodactylus townsendi]